VFDQKSPKKILLTGGAGYVGSHTAAVLIQAGFEVVILDNFLNSKPISVARLEVLTGKSIPLFVGDIRDTSLLEKLMIDEHIVAVMHFAGLKAVGESVLNPLAYFDTNIAGTISLINAMKASSVRTLVFSSSATVYGNPCYLPIDETHRTEPINPYGRSKLYTEEILSDLAASDHDWRIACLRYFNPVGAHESGLIGEDPTSLPNNLMPYISRVANGKVEALKVFGDNYDTKDGTGVRDYIHVMDLAEGHALALNFLWKNQGIHKINLGTGRGFSVLEVIREFEAVSGRQIPYAVVSRRNGDVAACYAMVNKAADLLGWQAKRTLTEICRSCWKFLDRVNHE
jgi:UDP-glucose 4-epimerase